MREKKTEVLKKILEVFKTNQTFFISGHLRPDGDSIGSQLALASLLNRLGKTVEIYSHDPLPDYAGYLPGADNIRNIKRVKKNYDVAIILECSDAPRMGEIIDLKKQVRTVINIDHHAYHTFFGNINFIDPRSSSNAELIYELFLKVGLPINLSEATNLYLGLVTDTGRFQYLNTTPNSLRISAKLLALGVNPNKISRWVYETKSYSGLLLLGKALGTLKLVAGGKIAYLSLTGKMYRQVGCSPNHTEEIIEYPTMIPGVKISIFLRETEEAGKIKVSFRSVEEVDVNRIAIQLGGGGHKNAAGATVNGSLNTACKKVIALAEKALK